MAGFQRNSTGMKPYRGRIAPSPTGLLHLGHAKTFGSPTNARVKPVVNSYTGRKTSTRNAANLNLRMPRWST